MSKHDFAKKQIRKKPCKKKQNKKKPDKKTPTMLYIFRYFKEIQNGIFVIKTMFEMVLFDWFL